MWEVHDFADTRRSKLLLGLSIGCAVVSALLLEFLVELCHTWVPLTYAVVFTPIAGSIAGLVCLFDARASAVAVAGKLVVIAVNLYQLGVAGIAMTGLGLFRCG